MRTREDQERRLQAIKALQSAHNDFKNLRDVAAVEVDHVWSVLWELNEDEDLGPRAALEGAYLDTDEITVDLARAFADAVTTLRALDAFQSRGRPSWPKGVTS